MDHRITSVCEMLLWLFTRWTWSSKTKCWWGRSISKELFIKKIRNFLIFYYFIYREQGNSAEIEMAGGGNLERYVILNCLALDFLIFKIKEQEFQKKIMSFSTLFLYITMSSTSTFFFISEFLYTKSTNSHFRHPRSQSTTKLSKHPRVLLPINGQIIWQSCKK